MKMFSPLLRSCFPYAMQTLKYDDAVAIEAPREGVREPNVSITNGGLGGNSITAPPQHSDDSDGGNSFNCGSSISGGRRYLPPCEPPPPTPYANVNYTVTEIEYAVPLVRRNCMETATGDCDVVIYENVRGIAVKSGSVETQSFDNGIVSEGRFLQVNFTQILPDYNSYVTVFLFMLCIIR